MPRPNMEGTTPVSSDTVYSHYKHICVSVMCYYWHCFILGMAVFLRNVSFHGIMLDALFEQGHPDWQKVHCLVSNGISDGTVKPLQTTVFDKDDIEAAFRFMAQGKHIGKVLIKVKCQFCFVFLSQPFKTAR